MSFSSELKEDLLHMPPEKACDLRAELAALTQTSASLGFRGGGRITVTYRTENAALARRIFRMLRGLRLAPQLHFVEHARLGGRKTCVLTVEGDDASALLREMGMMEDTAEGPALRRTTPHVPVSRQCCRQAYLRGAFLGAGAITGPDRGYHMEWVCQDEAMAQTLRRTLEHSGIPGIVYQRRGRTVVCLKNAQHIADALALMGAARARMALEDIRIRRQTRGNINRANNCDEHNDQRMIDASERQVRDIVLISVERGLFTLPPELQQLAQARLEHPEMGLQQLGQQLTPPLSKSGVNSRMRRLTRVAEEVRQRLEKGGNARGTAEHSGGSAEGLADAGRAGDRLPGGEVPLPADDRPGRVAGERPLPAGAGVPGEDGGRAGD